MTLATVECGEKINIILANYGEPPALGEMWETAMPKILNCVETMQRRIGVLEAVKRKANAFVMAFAMAPFRTSPNAKEVLLSVPHFRDLNHKYWSPLLAELKSSELWR